MPAEPDTWPPPPSTPVESGEWDAIIEVEMIGMPVEDGLRHGRLMLTLAKNYRLGAKVSRDIVTDYYRRHGIVDPKPKFRWTCFGYLTFAILFVGVIVIDNVLTFYEPSNPIQAHTVHQYAHLFNLIQALMMLLLAACLLARVRQLKAKKQADGLINP